jgi:predicted small lipoprotein YifL
MLMQAKTSLAAPRRAFDERAKTTLILLAGLAAGCGQKGPLTLPGAAKAASAPAASAPASAASAPPASSAPSPR